MLPRLAMSHPVLTLILTLRCCTGLSFEAASHQAVVPPFEQEQRCPQPPSATAHAVLLHTPRLFHPQASTPMLLSPILTTR